MRIVIIATGSRGDVEPYVALGKGLVKSGHTVRLVSHTTYTELVNSQGLEFWPVDVDVQDIAQSTDMQALLAGGNFLKVMSLMAKEAERSAHFLAKVGLSACLGMDIILTRLGGMYVGIARPDLKGLPRKTQTKFAYMSSFTSPKTYNPTSKLKAPRNCTALLI
jgi:sterol 3beta-glucosyltransferase